MARPEKLSFRCNFLHKSALNCSLLASVSLKWSNSPMAAKWKVHTSRQTPMHGRLACASSYLAVHSDNLNRLLSAFWWQEWRPASCNRQLAEGGGGGGAHSEMCLIFTLWGRAKCDLLLDSRQGTFRIQTWTVEPLSTWLKQGNTPQGVTGSVIELLSYNIINGAKVQNKMSLVPAITYNYFIWTVWVPHSIILKNPTGVITLVLGFGCE